MINLFIFCSFCRILGVRIRRRLKKSAVGFCGVLDGGFDFAEDFFVKAADML